MSRFRFGFVLGEFLFDYNQHLSVSPQRHGNRHVNEETIAKVAPVFATIHIFKNVKAIVAINPLRAFCALESSLRVLPRPS